MRLIDNLNCLIVTPTYNFGLLKVCFVHSRFSRSNTCNTCSTCNLHFMASANWRVDISCRRSFHAVYLSPHNELLNCGNKSFFSHDESCLRFVASCCPGCYLSYWLAAIRRVMLHTETKPNFINWHEASDTCCGLNVVLIVPNSNMEQFEYVLWISNWSSNPSYLDGLLWYTWGWEFAPVSTIVWIWRVSKLERRSSQSECFRK